MIGHPISSMRSISMKSVCAKLHIENVRRFRHTVQCAFKYRRVNGYTSLPKCVHSIFACRMTAVVCQSCQQPLSAQLAVSSQPQSAIDDVNNERKKKNRIFIYVLSIRSTHVPTTFIIASHAIEWERTLSKR